MCRTAPLTDAEFNEQWVTFWGHIQACALAEVLNEEELKGQLRLAPGALSTDTGLGYPGALIKHINLQTAIAERLVKMIGGTFQIDTNSLLKVCSLMHLSKTEMYIPTTEDWQIRKGYTYQFADLDGNLKFGERSILLATSKGIVFTPVEWEAMEALDKAKDNNGNKMVENILSTIIRQSNELAYAIEKKKDGK